MSPLLPRSSSPHTSSPHTSFPSHTLFLDSSGAAWATGFNKRHASPRRRSVTRHPPGSGQLGIGNTSNASQPQRVVIKPPVASLAAGGAHSALVTRQGLS